MKNVRVNVVVIWLVLMLSIVLPTTHQKDATSDQTNRIEINVTDCGPDVETVAFEIYDQNSLKRVYEGETTPRAMPVVDLPTGEYYLLARTLDTEPESGYIAYEVFKVTDRTTELVLDVTLRPASDHSVSVDLTPTIEDVPVPEGYTAVVPENDPYQVPLLIEEPSTNLIENYRLSRQPPKETDDYWLEFGGVRLHITHEETMNLWHPIALVDSELGSTHKLWLSYLDGQTLEVGSEVMAMGIAGTYQYFKTITYEVTDLTPTTASNGENKLRWSEFKHVYQSGDVYTKVYWNEYSYWWVYSGEFSREFISKWYTASEWVKDYNYEILEAREIYRGEWRSGTTKDLKIADTAEYTGGLGFEVGKKDVWGASAKIQFTCTHTVEAMHRISWAPPSPTVYLKLYGGNLFDVNTYSYDSDSGGGGGGGGCPFVSTWDGSQYLLDNNILFQSELYGSETDWIDRYVLSNDPALADGYHHLMISEFENEHSFIDRATLLAVAHSPSSRIAIDPNGQIMSYRSPASAIGATCDDGTDLTGVLESEDGYYFAGTSGTSVVLEFDVHTLRHGARLVMYADEKTPWSIRVDVENEGQWLEAGMIFPRERWAHEIISLDHVLPEEYGSTLLRIRLRWTANHKVDFVGLDTKPVLGFQTYELPLAAALHSVHGDVFDRLQYPDDVYAELLPGEELYLYFYQLDSKDTKGRSICYAILVEGRYYTLS